jgi:hypothetical protein
LAVAPPVAANQDSRTVKLDGNQEAQAADRDGRGTFTFTLTATQLCYVLTVEGIAPATAAHIHVGERGVAGPIVVGLETPTSGASAGCITVAPAGTPDSTTVLTAEEFAAIQNDPRAYYVNVHNADFPGGAIRGQLK